MTAVEENVVVAEPFPMVGEPLQSHAQVWRLPVGSRIGYRGESGNTLHSDGLWYDEHAGPEDGNGTPSDEWIVPDENWVVQHLPTLAFVDLQALPVGSLVFWPYSSRAEKGVYRKYRMALREQIQFEPIPDGRTSNRNCLMDGCVLVWRPDAELRRGLVLRGEADMNRCPVGTSLHDINAPRAVTLTAEGWRWEQGQEQEALDGEWAIGVLGDGPVPGLAPPVPTGEAETTPEPVRIEPAAVLPGMYLEVDDSTRVFILTRTGERYSALVLIAGARPRVDARRTFRHRAYRLVEQDSDLVTALATLLGDGGEQARNEAVTSAVADVNRSWATRVERFNAAFWDVVDNNHLDDDIADDLAQQHSTILTPRTSEYEVTLTVTGTHKRTVRAHSGEDAVENAIEDTGFHDGLSATLYQEDFYVTSVEGDAEEA